MGRCFVVGLIFDCKPVCLESAFYSRCTLPNRFHETDDNGVLKRESVEEVMAAGWVTVLQMVPWGEVIKNAPKVADGAVKLWNSVSRKKIDGESDGAVTDVVLATDVTVVEKLNQRLYAAEHTISDLQAQVVQSAEVIKELASQNTQLVAQIESNRKAVTVLGVVLALSILAVVVQAVVLFSA
jgi:hypothetical protein